jgi:glutamate N-acetyltransferase/amino-acid N-acetyltransferase
LKLPKGFLASGIRSGIRKKRPDLALIVAENGATAAAVFTQNRFKAAPVVLSQAALRKSGGQVRAVVVNAGCANAVTGKPGMDAAKRVRTRAAQLLDCPEEQIFLCSTGVIGEVLPDAKIRTALPDAVTRLSAGGLDAASHAILTTDVGPKTASVTFDWHGKRARLVGFAKGAGMIHPNMATMLGFLMTDIPAAPEALKASLKKCVDTTFNAISVDGDTSTNDTVLLMASGTTGGPSLGSSADSSAFDAALMEICRKLAWMIVRDGEGATRVLEVQVRGAKNLADAKLAAHAVSTSPLVKTAIHGGDPNWGRIIAAVGRSGARFSTTKVSLTLAGVSLLSGGTPVAFNEKDVAKRLQRELINLSIDLGAGEATTSMMTCDFGHDYVALNADYRS